VPLLRKGQMASPSRHHSVHPLRSPELRALRQLKRDYPDTQYVFVSERKVPLSTRSVRHLVARAGRLAGIEGRVHQRSRIDNRLPVEFSGD
jgi:site-specific recombinase XerD